MTATMLERDAVVDGGVPAEAVTAVEEQLTLLFHRIRASWKDYATHVHPELQPMGYKMLGSLVRSGPMHSGVLAEILHTDKSVVSRQVRHMESLGLIESRADASDGRARTIAATPLAVQRFEAVRTSNQQNLHRLLGSWPEADVRAFAEALRKLGEPVA